MAYATRHPSSMLPEEMRIEIRRRETQLERATDPAMIREHKRRIRQLTARLAKIGAVR